MGLSSWLTFILMWGLGRSARTPTPQDRKLASTIEDTSDQESSPYSYGYEMDVFEECAMMDPSCHGVLVEALSTGDTDTLCSSDLSCLHDCDPEVISTARSVTMHCICGLAPNMFEDSYEFDFEEAYCCGDDTCKVALTAFASDMGTDMGYGETEGLSRVCAAIPDIRAFCGNTNVPTAEPAATPVTYNTPTPEPTQAMFEGSYIFDECARGCTAAVVAAMESGDADALCSLRDLRCLEGCKRMEGVSSVTGYFDVHCQCDLADTKRMFDEAYQFDPEQAYCCGDDTCKDAVASYVEANPDSTGEQGLDEVRKGGCRSFTRACPGQPTPGPTPQPSQEPTGHPFPAPTPAPSAAPVPGAVFTLPGGAQTFTLGEGAAGATGSFTLALTTAPLSDVKVTFSSELGRVRFDPPSAVFTYANFNKAQAVAVAAVDDAVDNSQGADSQGAGSSGRSYADAVKLAYSSRDSVQACRDVRPKRPCGQAAAYGGFSDATTEAGVGCSITDDDTAGVAVSESTLHAFFDNYGDAIGYAEYTLRLLSMPAADVTITLGGLTDEHARVSSPFDAGLSWEAPTVTIPKKSWTRPYLLRVAVDAPVAARPVCANGRTSCEALDENDPNQETRFTLTHAVSSEDGAYDGLAAVGSVAVAASVVHDPVEPPVLEALQFADLLNALTLTFDKDTDRAGLAGKFECGEVLEVPGKTEKEAWALFGDGSYCVFTSSTELKVFVGRGATVASGDQLRVKDGVVKSGEKGVSLFMHGAANPGISAAAPLTPIVPRVVLSASSESVGVCDDLKLDGSGSEGSGGRSMAVQWSVTSEGDVASLEELLSTASSKGWYRVHVPSAVMALGSSFTVTLTATNFLNEVHSASVTIGKLSVPAPTLKIMGEHPVTTATRSSELRLAVSAELPSLECVEDLDLANAKMTYVWHEDNGLLTDEALSGTTRNPRLLRLDAGVLHAGTTYAFRVEGYMTDVPAVTNEATVEVQVGSQDLVAVVEGVRLAGRDVAFTLDGGSSVDPDDDSAPFAFAWACTTCELPESVAVNEASLTVPANALPTGTHEFELTVSKGGRTKAATTEVVVVAGAPPSVEIAPLGNTKYNVEDQFVILEGSVATTGGIGYSSEWVAVGSDVEAPFLNIGRAVASVAGELQTVVSLRSLTPGGTYTLKLMATDLADDSAAYSTVTLTMNEAPSSGSVSSDPTSGYALETAFSFSALNWVDEDYPLTYIFGTAEVSDVDGTVDGTKLSPFGNKRSDATYDGVTLSQGTYNSTVGCFVVVVDSYGATGSSTGSVQVGVKPMSVKQLRQISENRTKDAIEQGDADTAKQVLKATTGGLRDTTDTGGNRRRSLLGRADAAAKVALRASVLTNLESTYAITDVTQPDVASLFGVLKGVVEVPGEVDEDVASRSLSFLKTVLDASLSAGVGLDATAADSVATAVSHLFEAGVFNGTADRAKSYGYASTVVEVMGLLSACQLDGAPAGVGAALLKDDVDVYTMRGTAGSLVGAGAPAVALSDGGLSTDAVTSSSLAEATGSDLGMSAGESFDLRVATFKKNPFGAYDGWTAGEADASRLDQPGGMGNGDYLLRSKVTIVDVAISGSGPPLAVSGLSDSAPVLITLKATAPFDNNTTAYTKTFSCNSGNDGAAIDAGCPLTTWSHTCDLAANGGGGNYFFTYTCPRVVPTCLFWDEASSAFSDVGCSVRAGYTADAVTCACSHLTSFVLGATSTNGEFTVGSSPGPSQLPTPQPTVAPSVAATESVEVSMDLTGASRAPLDADKAALKDLIVTTLDVTTASVKAFAVTSVEVTTRRRLQASNAGASAARRLATTYTWTAAFLVTSADFSGSDMGAGVTSALSAMDAAAVAAGAAVDAGSVVSTPTPRGGGSTPGATPSATPANPTPDSDGGSTGGAGIPAAAASAGGATDSSGDRGDDFGFGAETASLGGVVGAGVGVLVLLAAVVMCLRRRQQAADEDVKFVDGGVDDNEVEFSQLNPARQERAPSIPGNAKGPSITGGSSEFPATPISGFPEPIHYVQGPRSGFL